MVCSKIDYITWIGGGGRAIRKGVLQWDNCHFGKRSFQFFAIFKQLNQKILESTWRWRAIDYLGTDKKRYRFGRKCKTLLVLSLMFFSFICCTIMNRVWETREQDRVVLGQVLCRLLLCIILKISYNILAGHKDSLIPAHYKSNAHTRRKTQ